MGIRFVNAKPKSRRIRCLDISASMLLEIFRDMDATRLLKCESIPKDAKIVGLTVDEIFDTVRLWVESKEFEPVEEMYAFPPWNLQVSTFTPQTVGSDRLLFEVGEEIVAALEDRRRSAFSTDR